MISRRRIVAVTTDGGAPGLMLYGLHNDLPSEDTDDTDYEPGKKVIMDIKSKGNRKKKKLSSSEESSEVEDENPKTEKEKPRKRKDNPVKTNRKRIRPFADDMNFYNDQTDSSDNEYVPDDYECNPKKTKSKMKKNKLGRGAKPKNRGKKLDRSCTTKSTKIKEDDNSSSDSSDTTDDDNKNKEEGECLNRKFDKDNQSLAPNDDTWSILPVEILSNIFRLICSSDDKGARYVCRCAQICRHWRDTVRQPVSWRVVDLAFIAQNLTGKKADTVLSDLSKHKLSEARELILSGWLFLTDEGLSAVAENCPKLEHLNIASCQRKSISKLSSVSLIPIAENCSLKKINLSNVRIKMNYGKTVIQFIDICGSNLTSINFSGNISFSSATLHSIIHNCSKLEFIDVSNTSVRSVNFKDLQEKCPLIQELYFANLSIEPKDKVAELRECPGFQHLRVGSFATYHNSSWMSDVLMSTLCKHALGLTTLDIRGCQGVLDLDLPATSLERLYLSQCRLDVEISHVICSKWSSTLWDLDLSKVADSTSTNYTSVPFDQLLRPLIDGDEPCLNLMHLNLAGTSVSDHLVKRVVECCLKLKTLDLTSCRAVSRGQKRQHVGKKQLKKLRKFYQYIKK